MEKIKKAWIQGNIISFKKPTYKSAVFDLEEVLVIPIKTIENKNFNKISKIIEKLLIKENKNNE